MVTSINRDESILQLYPCNVNKCIKILKYWELIVKIEKIPRHLFYNCKLISDIIIIKFESLLFIGQSLAYI